MVDISDILDVVNVDTDRAKSLASEFIDSMKTTVKIPNYKIDYFYRLGDIVNHPEFGPGIVIKKSHHSLAAFYFPDQNIVKTLISGYFRYCDGTRLLPSDSEDVDEFEPEEEDN
jgi:hypothetical protein